MKRVLTFDFLRGIAIIGVLLFHVLNFAFADKVDIIGDALGGVGTVEAYWYVLGPVLLILGSFNGMFVMVSAASNSISVGKQWERMVVEKEISKDKAFKSILISQLIRGGLIWTFGYISENILGTLFGAYYNSLIGETSGNLGMEFLKGLFFTNILYTIGISIIFTSLIQLLYLRGGLSKKAITAILLTITIGCTAAIPLIQWIDITVFGTNSFSSGLESITPGEGILRFFLAIFISRGTPLIPFFSCAAIGSLMAIFVNESAIRASVLRKFFYVGLLFLAGSFLIGAITGIDLNGDRATDIFFQTFILGLEIISLSWLVYMIDFRKKTRIELFARCTTWIRRFGIMTLTLWMLQYFMVFPLQLIEAITGWPIIEGGLVDWQMGIVLLILFFMWHFILWLWEKGRFIGSFEWLTTLILSGRGSGDRKEMNGILYHPERMIQHVPETENKVNPTERGLIIANLVFAGFYALVIALVASGVLKL